MITLPEKQIDTMALPGNAAVKGVERSGKGIQKFLRQYFLKRSILRRNLSRQNRMYSISNFGRKF
jgi:hypothetical protein